MGVEAALLEVIDECGTALAEVGDRPQDDVDARGRAQRP